jgi:hypothetical protein
MIKVVIYDLITRSFLSEFGSNGAKYVDRATEAYDFQDVETAKRCLLDAAYKRKQRTKENSFWVEGFALTVLEVYV